MFDREVERKRPPPEAQEAEPKPSARGGPLRDPAVEALCLGRRSDRRPCGSLPARSLDGETLVEQRVEALAPVRDLERDLASLLELPPSREKTAQQPARPLALVRGPVSCYLDVRRALEGSLDEPVSLPRRRGPEHLLRCCGIDERERDAARSIREQRFREGRRRISLAEDSELRRVPVRGRFEPARFRHQRDDRDDALVPSQREDPGVTTAECPPPRNEPSRAIPGWCREIFRQRLPFLLDRLEGLVTLRCGPATTRPHVPHRHPQWNGS